MQIVKDYCDKCKEELDKFRVRVRFEYSSRSSYGREYCSSNCAKVDMDNLEQYSQRKDMSS